MEPPEGCSASHSKAQLRLPSVPMQVVLRDGRGWRFLRQRRSVVWVYTKPGVGGGGLVGLLGLGGEMLLEERGLWLTVGVVEGDEVEVVVV